MTVTGQPTELPYVLVDGEERARRAPATFSLPSREVRVAVGIGDYAKVGFELPEEDARSAEVGGERMWVKVTQAQPVGDMTLYEGLLANDPVHLDLIGFGSVIAFESTHVLDVMSAQEVQDVYTQAASSRVATAGMLN